VRDHGPGLAEETRQRLFEPFYRGAEARARRLPGLGLGLAVARHAAARLHGDLRLDASCRAGCQFVLTLPGDATTLERVARFDACYETLQPILDAAPTTLATLQGPAVFEPRAAEVLSAALQRELGADAVVIVLADTTAIVATPAPVRRTWQRLAGTLAAAAGGRAALATRAGIQRLRRGAGADECVLQGLVRSRFPLPTTAATEVRRA
jgi:hypothetical protein